jgi:hypothetical protein
MQRLIARQADFLVDSYPPDRRANALALEAICAAAAAAGSGPFRSDKAADIGGREK